MEQTPLPPLVSDEYLSSLTPISEDWKDGPCSPVTPTEVRNIYEAERSKLMEKITRLEGKTNFEVVPKEQYDRTREVVQGLVDLIAELRCKEGCRKYEPGGTAPLCYQCGERHRIIALAKSINIEPTK